MRAARTWVLGILACLAWPGPVRGEDAPVPAETAAPALARADLVVPDDLWAQVLARLERPPGGTLGYSTEEMAHYGRDQRITRPIATMFRDVRAVARASGKLSDDLLGAAKDPAEVVRMAHGLTDAVAARNLPRPEGAAWGVPWIGAGTVPAEALDAVLARLAAIAGTKPIPLSDEQERSWHALPEPVQRLVVRFLVGAAEGLPWLRVAFDDAALVRALEGRGPQDLTVPRLLRLASRPWTEEDESLSAPLSRAGFDLLGRVDRDYLCLGSVLALVHMGVGVAEWRAARETVDLSNVETKELWVDTAFGAVRILGRGDDTIEGGAGPTLLAVDLAGRDAWRGRVAVPSYPVAPVSVAVDLSGDDAWDGGALEGTVACGLFGLGALFDLSGDDRYAVAGSGLACAWYGTGLLWDEAGNDVYEVRTKWGSAAAHVGAAVLVDLAGNDRHVCGHQSQGMGSTYGAGVLLDLAGDDVYEARDDGNREAIYLDQSVAMSQGCGYGRRADLSDGHSLAGGFGVLVDAAGNDRYHAQCWAQGCAYWWAVGILEDRGGNDVYENGKYSLGAAAHFGVGCQVDLAGDDAYNQGVTTAVNQYQGHARDGSLGVSIDGGGDDRYQLRTHGAGSGDLGSVGFFWDRSGDDVYEVRWNDLGKPNGWNETPPMGTATRTDPMRSFRDELGTYGVFLDTGGRDAYRWDVDARLDAKDEATWTHRSGPRSFGVGIDTARFPKVPPPPGDDGGGTPAK